MKHCNFLKTLYMVAMLIMVWSNGFSQQNASDVTLYYQLRSPLAKFREANKRYQIQSDTIFHVKRGFKINPAIDEIEQDGTTYMVITYINISSSGRQRLRTPMRDSLERVVEEPPVNFPLFDVSGAGRNDKFLVIEKAEFEKLAFDTVFSVLRGRSLQTGQLTIPFKLRPKQGDTNFQMTTDVTVGAYVGLRQRLSPRHPFFITIPFNLGLTFININENTTSTTASEGSGIVPGWTWATGLIFEYNKANAGVVFGRDYASGVGNEWIYQNKTWWSFAIGYSFMR